MKTFSMAYTCLFQLPNASLKPLDLNNVDEYSGFNQVQKPANVDCSEHSQQLQETTGGIDIVSLSQLQQLCKGNSPNASLKPVDLSSAFEYPGCNRVRGPARVACSEHLQQLQKTTEVTEVISSEQLQQMCIGNSTDKVHNAAEINSSKQYKESAQVQKLFEKAAEVDSAGLLQEDQQPKKQCKIGTKRALIF
jgi:hypothetical protein